MNYLLDTNIISETFRNRPNENLLNWLEGIESNNIYTSVLVLGEIRKGVESLENEAKKQKIILWLEKDLLSWFEQRILPIDAAIADKWGYITAKKNNNINAVDSLLAATCLAYNMKLVTRNVKDFQYSELEIINPFDVGR